MQGLDVEQETLLAIVETTQSRSVKIPTPGVLLSLVSQCRWHFPAGLGGAWLIMISVGA